MSFTDSEKTDIRRFCGYGMYGDVATTDVGYRYTTNYGLLEYRMNHMQPSEETIVRDVYLANLRDLEVAIVGTSDNLDTAKAAVWTHNPNELEDREKLFTSWRIRLAGLFSIPYGESSSSTVRLVV